MKREGTLTKQNFLAPLAALALLTGVALPAGPVAAAPEPVPPSTCPPPPEALPLSVTLPHVTAALAAGQPLRILALGGASTAGSGLKSPDRAFPQRLAEKLRALAPRSAISVINRGHPGETTRSMVKRLASAIATDHPGLVLWEAGTTEAIDNSDPMQLDGDVERGLELLRRAQIDVILIDMQYSPAMAAMVDFDPYVDSLRRAAEAAGVPLFDRFAAMRAWGDSGLFHYDDPPADDAEPMAERVHGCVAEGLAEIVRRRAGR